jgi:hypothetical protein
MRADDHSPETRIKGGDGTGRRIVGETVAAIRPPSMQGQRSAAMTASGAMQLLGTVLPMSLQQRQGRKELE